MSIRPVNAVIQAVMLIPRLGRAAPAILLLLAACSWGGGSVRQFARLAEGAPWWLPLVAGLPTLVAATLLAPMVMVMTLDRLADRPGDVWSALRRVARCYPLLLVVNLILALPSLPVAWVHATPMTKGLLYMGVGLAGVLIEALLTPLLAIIVMERRPLMAALARTLRLNRGRRLPVTMALLVHALAYAALVLGVSLGLTYLMFASSLPREPYLLLDKISRALVYGAGSIVGAALTAVLYRRLGEAQGGLMETDIDEVFG